MRDDRTRRQRPRLAWLTAALAVMGASRATAQVCDPQTNCGPGYVCATSQGTSCSCGPIGQSDGGARDAVSVPSPAPWDAAVIAGGDPDAGGCQVTCVPVDYHYCTAAPCTADTDCPSSMVCYAQSYYECSGGSGCAPGLDCDADGGGYTCTEHTSRTCAERHNVPCRVDQDCGPGFDCNRDPYTSCSGGGGIGVDPDGGWVFIDAGSECSTVTPETGWCALLELPCESDSECPETMSCQTQYEYPPCVPVWDGSVAPVDAGGAVADAGAGFPLDPDAGFWPSWPSSWECPPPVVVSHVCRPQSWGGGGSIGGFAGGGAVGGFAGGGAPGGGYVPDAGTSSDAGAAPGSGVGGGGYAGGAVAGGGVGGSGSADAGGQGPGAGGDQGEDDEHGHGHGQQRGRLSKLLKRLFGPGGCSVAGEGGDGNLAWLSALSLLLVARVRRRRE